MTAVILAFAAVLALAQAPPPAVAEARALLKQGNAGAAIEVLQRAVKAAPEDAALHDMLGSLLNSTGRYPEALTHTQAAVSLAPETVRYRLNRGIVLVEHGRFTEAVADFDFALERNESLVYGYLERGSALLSLDHVEQARAQWALARAADPKLIWPEWYEGVHDFLDGRHADAAARFDRVAAAVPGFAPAAVWRNLARARAGLPFAETPPQDEAWPAPLYRLLRGALTLDQVLAIAKQDHVTGDPRRIGEALFVAAEIAAVSGRTAEARSLYERAAAVPAPRHAWKIAAERAMR